MNVGEWSTRWAERYPHEALIKCGDDLAFTKGEFNLRVNRLGHALQEAGVKKGDRVAVLLANTHVYLEILQALCKLGGVMVPLNFRLAAPELEFILNDSEPVMLVYSPEFLPLVEEIRGKVPSVKQFICELAGGAESDNEYEAWVANRSEEEPKPDSEVTYDDPEFIMYTSGTTGRPKGAVVLQGNIQWNCINSVPIYSFSHTDVQIVCAPMFHVGGLGVSAIPSLYVGCKMVIQRFFDPSGIFRLIEDEKVTVMFGIPVMFLFMTQVPEFENADLSSIRLFLAGGSPCPRPLIETYMKRGVTFSQGYGMTETAPAITVLRAEDALRKLGSCGKPVFHLDVNVVNLEGEKLPAGETGEVIVRGPNVIREYWRRPEASAESIVDGWLHTGDMGYYDEEGYLYLIDRKKDMYISGGENVYPAEVEDAIMGFDRVGDVGVIGIPDEKWGEVGMAIVVPKPGEEVSEESVIEFCKGRLAKYKVPKKVLFTEELPRTATGKILKKVLKAQYTPE
jgi:fatty-acyl-CoA synthase